MLRHAKGPKAGQPFALLDWQRKLLRDVFGWKRQDGSRRYRTVYVEIPRKNGKTLLAAGVALYLLVADGEEGAEVYSAASTREQASLAYDAALSMVRTDDVLSANVKQLPSWKKLVFEKRNSVYKAIPAEAAGAHGFNASGIIFDELHTQPDRELWDVLTTSTGARRQPLTFAITTAGHDRSSICWELHCKAKAILEGNLVDDSFYPVIYGIDETDEWTDESVWAKANPSLGEAVSLDYLRQECEKAKHSPAYENTFRNLHLGQWTEQAVRWLPMHAWDECRGEIHDGGVWCGGLDLAASRDVNSFVLTKEEGECVYVKAWFWAPAESIDQRSHHDRRQVRNWMTQGHIRTTPGATTDYATIRADIMQILSEHQVETIAYDGWNATDFMQQLVAAGLDESKCVKFPQTIGQFAEPTRRLDELVASRKLVHDGSPVLRWMAGNVTVTRDSAGNMRPDKAKSQDKIDGIVAAIMALRETMATSQQSAMPCIY